MSKSVTYKDEKGNYYYSPRSLPKKINMEKERDDWLAYLEKHGNDVAQAKAALAVGLNEKNAESRLMLLAFAEAFTYKYMGFGDAAIPKDSNNDDILQGEYWLPKEIIKKIKQDKIATSTIQKYIRDEVSKPPVPHHADPNAASAGPMEETDVVKRTAKEMNLPIDDDGDIDINSDEQFGDFIRRIFGYTLQEGKTKQFDINGIIVVLPDAVDEDTLRNNILTVLRESVIWVGDGEVRKEVGGSTINTVIEVQSSMGGAATGAPPPEQPKSPPVHPDPDTQPVDNGQSNTGAPPAQQTASQQEQLQQTGAADPPKPAVLTQSAVGGTQPASSNGSFHTVISGGSNNDDGNNNNDDDDGDGGNTDSDDATNTSGSSWSHPTSSGMNTPLPIPPTATPAQIVAAVTTTPDTQIYINRLAVKIADKTSVKVHRKESAVDRLVRRGAENLDKALRFPDRSNAEVLKAGTCASNWSLVNGIRKSLGLIDRASWVTM